MKEKFISIINQGLESAELITDPKDRAMAYAALGSAIGASGLLGNVLAVAEMATPLLEVASAPAPAPVDQAAAVEAAVVAPPVAAPETGMSEEETERYNTINAYLADVEAGNPMEDGSSIVDAYCVNFSQGAYQHWRDIPAQQLHVFFEWFNIQISDQQEAC